MIKFVVLFLVVIAANIAGSKGIIIHKYLKQAYDVTAKEWHDADSAKAQP